MKHTIHIYRSLSFDGNIYVKTNHPSDVQAMEVTLFKNGEKVAEQVTQNAVTVFKDNPAGAYRAEAKIALKDAEVITVVSKEIVIKAIPVAQAAKVVAMKRRTNQRRQIANPAKGHYLEAKIPAGSLEKLKEDVEAIVRNVVPSKAETLHFEKNPDNVFAGKATTETYKIRLKATNDSLIEIAEETEKLDYVIYCAVTPDATNMVPADLPPPLQEKAVLNSVSADEPTPDFTGLQTYLDATVCGMNVRAAWSKGITGRSATVRHLDFGIYKEHEDIKNNITVVNSRPETEDCNHGTASTGCIAAIKNDFGVTGIAHDCNFYFYDVIGGFELIIRDATPGDIVILDSQYIVGEKLLPLIYSRSDWEKINALVDMGVVVILAAGNGGLDLSPEQGNMPDYGDSGSMLVGACHHNTGKRVSFSNYGHSTSLISSWGDWSVVTTGYGSLQRYLGNNRNYRHDYAGTSSATPLCAGALALIQSYAIENYGVFLNSWEMREVIVRTGYDEGLEDGIGYRPNVYNAIQNLADILGFEHDPFEPPFDASSAKIVDFSINSTEQKTVIEAIGGPNHGYVAWYPGQGPQDLIWWVFEELGRHSSLKALLKNESDERVVINLRGVRGIGACGSGPMNTGAACGGGSLNEASELILSYHPEDNPNVNFAGGFSGILALKAVDWNNRENVENILIRINVN